jgi:inorganic pyrophosphatase
VATGPAVLQAVSDARSKGFAMAKSKNRALANPARLAPFEDDDADTIQVVVETPKRSRNKYAFDTEERVFSLSKVLPAGMTFPYDFGFVPSTRADDGDPVDVLVLMDEPAFPGCVLQCRPIGVIEGEQIDGKRKTRNDRIVAVEQANHAYATVKHIDDLGKRFVSLIAWFATAFVMWRIVRAYQS